MRTVFPSVVCGALFFGYLGNLEGETFAIRSDPNDRAWRSTEVGINAGQTTARIGTETAGQTTCFVVPFQLPELPPGEVITEAGLRLFSEAQANLNGQARVDVRGVRVASSAVTQSADITGGSLVVNDAYVLNAGIPVQQFLTFGSDDLVNYLRGIYATDPNAPGKYVILSVFPDVANSAGSRYVTVSTADNATVGHHPTLDMVTELPNVSSESITHRGVTWELLGTGHSTGVFVTGDPWVVGPVTVIGITNSLNSSVFIPRKGQNGSMVNPLVGHDRQYQGYDDGLTTYRESLNAGLPNGQPLSSSNPLVLENGSTVISMVSWLYSSASVREPGCPAFNLGTNTPRPTTRSAGVLTVLDEPPPPNAFRPPYAGSNKAVRFAVEDLKTSLLKKLAPPANAPSPDALAQAMGRTWVDHGYEYLGAMFHPSEHMPNYGRDMAAIVGNASLLLNLDFQQLPGSPDKMPLLIAMVQFGIDLCGIADNGGGWPANGGHHLGRFWPVLFAGLMLDDPRMKSVGTWGRHRGSGFEVADAGLTEFQEFQNQFYVSMADVEITNGPSWSPDTRGDLLPYAISDIGTPEWGIRHSSRPATSNAAINTPYRDINGSCSPAFALAARIMGVQNLWNHDPYFDYADRYMALTGGGTGANTLSAFAKSMWQMYAASHDVVSYNDFLLGYFTPLEIDDDLVSGRGADPEGDGLNNLLEYYFGTHPRLGSVMTKTPLRAEGAHLVLEHLTRVRPPNGRMAWQSSPDLVTWGPAYPESLSFTEKENGLFQLEAGFPWPGSGRMFYRVKVLD